MSFNRIHADFQNVIPSLFQGGKALLFFGFLGDKVHRNFNKNVISQSPLLEQKLCRTDGNQSCYEQPSSRDVKSHKSYWYYIYFA